MTRLLVFVFACWSSSLGRRVHIPRLDSRVHFSCPLGPLANLLSVSPVASLRVVVTGAAGKTGQIVLRKLLSQPNKFTPVGIVRTDESNAKLVESGALEPEKTELEKKVEEDAFINTFKALGDNFRKSGKKSNDFFALIGGGSEDEEGEEESQEESKDEEGEGANSVIVADVTDPSAIAAAIRDCEALVICTSATPAPTDAMDESTGRPIFGYPNGQPEQVDWLGQKAQIDAAKVCGPKTHVVLCSSMGGTEPDNMLNGIGRETLPDGSTRGGNILKWKRKAEKYLIDSGLPYTIVHPGGLIDEPGGKREIVIGVDDDRTEGERSIPREDVAEVMVQALLDSAYRGRSFDIRSKKEEEGTVTTDFAALLAKLEGKNSDYNLGEIA